MSQKEQELAQIQQLCSTLDKAIIHYLKSAASQPTIQPAYEKLCKYGCNQTITLRKINDKWTAFNLDGSEHKCRR